MDIVTFALCKKMTQNGVSSDEVQQQINEIKNSISELQTGQGESDLEIQAIQTAIQTIEGKINEVDMFDILKKYNVAQKDPLGADYDEMAIDLVDGKTAFWLNGNWAWPNLEEAGAEPDDEYGFLPFFMSNDEDDFANQQIQGSPSKQIMLDGQMASESEQAAAKEFLNWIVYSEIGQQMLVYTCSLIPPFHNNPYEPTDPLSRAIYEKVQSGGAFNASAIVPNDHWSILGAAMQKYLADRSDRDELIESIEEYWAEQE